MRDCGTCDGGLLYDLSPCPCLLAGADRLVARALEGFIASPVASPVASPEMTVMTPAPVHGPVDSTLDPLPRRRNPYGERKTACGSRGLNTLQGSRIRRRLRVRGPYTGRLNRWA